MRANGSLLGSASLNTRPVFNGSSLMQSRQRLMQGRRQSFRNKVREDALSVTANLDLCKFEIF